MSISFSGLASGLDTDSWVTALTSVKQLTVTSLKSQLSGINQEQTALSNVKTAFTKLQSALQTLTDSKFNKGTDIFAANKATSSNTDVFTASVTADAIRDTYDINVKQLATTTVAKSIDSASKVADGSTKLSDLGITEGSVTVYVDGVKSTINIDANDTVSNLQSRLSTAGATMTIDPDSGFMTIKATAAGEEIKIGANTDTSNIVSLLGLAETEDGAYESATAVYKVNGSTLLTAANSGFNTQITEGTFKIGNAEFTIDSTTTLDNLISQINNSDAANVYASWDAATGALVLKSASEGASFISVEAGTSNFTEVIGLTNGDKLVTAAQTLGQNAIVSINGTDVTSTSNTVTADVSRITGLTLTLKKANDAETGATNLVIEHDADRLNTALEDVITAYNELMSTIDTSTGVDGILHGETTLKSFYSSIRGIANGANANSGKYSLLSQIGISTTEASSAMASDTVSLELDTDKLAEVLAHNTDSVKELLIGDNGVLTKIKDTIDNSLRSTGYFSTKSKSLSSEVRAMNEKIAKRQAEVDSYKARLENKFAAMENTISMLNSNYNSLTGLSSL